MKTAELVRNDNVYRAIGRECWLGTYQTVIRDAIGDRLLRPVVRKVQIVKAANDNAIVVSAVRGDGRQLTVPVAAIHDDRAAAERYAERCCEAMHGMQVPFSDLGRYVYHAPAPAALQYRAKALDSRLWTVQYRDPAASSRWLPVIGLFRLTKWKANDCVKRLERGDDIPGFWKMPGSMEFIELADNCE